MPTVLSAFNYKTAGGRLLRTTHFRTAGSGTWTKPPDTVSIEILTIAGGGGGGGDNGIVGGGGGNAGSHAELYIANAKSSYAYVVGAGGAGGATNTAGSAGGATTIAGIAGGAGTGGPYGGTTNASVSAVTTGGDLNGRGAAGEGWRTGDDKGAVGGASILGGSSRYGGAGVAGVLGAGGNGAGVGNTGGAGGPGYIRIKEYS